MQGSFFIWGNPGDFLVTDAESVKGMGTSDPFTKTEFTNYSPQIWKFVEGAWPELANVVVAIVEE